ncbi:MAG: proton-conducting transporter membrane subunit [Thermoproteota archaeon]
MLSIMMLKVKIRNGSSNYASALLSYIPAIVASLFTIILSVSTIVTDDTTGLSVFNVLPFIDFEIKIDGVAAFFMLLLGIVSFSVSIYSIAYSRMIDSDKGQNASSSAAATFGFLFNVFILSMMLVIVSNNAFFFLFFWEIMSIISFFFMVQGGRDGGAADSTTTTKFTSSLSYLVMTHAGTAFITALFLIMFSQTGSFSFDSFTEWSSSSAATTPQVLNIKNAAFILGFIGFGIKAGMVPFHTWLPKAYPLAPSNISALMSGAMIKMAIYGLVRMLLDLNSIGASLDYAWWGVLMIASGSASSVVGVLYAVVSNDIKRTIAFSSVENMGIIFIGLGLSVVFLSYGLTTLHDLAILASMLHAANHAFFKSLLFMGAGSVESRTHTTNMEKLGGLVKKMPYTSLTFLIGSISIAGLPPFNGFVSEWLTMQALLFTSQIPSTLLQISLGFASLAFALSIGTSVAVFVKLFGMSFLARARSSLSSSAKEVPKLMIFGKSILALLCIVFGILPATGINLISSAFDIESADRQLGIFGTIELQKNSEHNFASLSMPSIVVMILSLGAAAAGFLYVVRGIRRKDIFKTATTTTASSLPALTWYAGYQKAGGSRNEYSAASFSQPIQVVFRMLYKTKTSISRAYHSEANPYLRKSTKVQSTSLDIFEAYFYTPMISASIFILDKIRKIQTGKVNAYLLYIMLTLILLLMTVRLGVQ